MNKLLRHVSFFIMKEVFRCFVRLRISWRKLFFAGAIMTVVGVVLHMQFISQPVTISSYSSLNGLMKLSNTHNEAKIEQFQLNTATPILSLNSSSEVLQSVPVEGKRGTDSPRRRRKVDDALTVTTSSPPPSTPPSPLQRYIWTLSPSEALLFAKKEIERSPIIIEDPELYAPIFRNVSMFKRSYELMEMTLKVYIYPDGKRPIFHQPHLRGIYASEGWFMKLLSENKQFVTRDPEKAHLFYLPYSAYQLGMTLYAPNSHTLKPLSIFLRDYVNMIAAKYPFWNRTHGKDHFIVACHDWGPYTTALHKELSKNAIKALCNADPSEGVFVAGKDVSLPETSTRNPKKLHRSVGGGMKVSQRPFLAFFAGNVHGRVRPRLLRYWRDKDKDMRIYGHIGLHITRNMSYIQHMKSSKYYICPMDFEVNSPRIAEAIYYECVPVIIADNFVLPLSEILDWSAFSVVVAEKDIPKLKEILLDIPDKIYDKMLYNGKKVQKHFLWNQRPIKYDMFHMILHSIWLNRLNQTQDLQSQ